MLDKVQHIIAVHSAKGGVGKSTLTVNLACALAKRGYAVGLMDADVHGPSGPLMMGKGEWPDHGKDENTVIPITAHGVKFISMGNLVTKKTPLIWRGAMVHSVMNQFLNNVVWGELDFLFIDMPPGTGDAQLSISQGASLTGAVVVSTPQELALVDTIRGMRAFQQMNVPLLGLVENMAYFICDDCGDRAALFGEGGAALMADELNIPVLASIPIEPLVGAGSDTGRPFVLANPGSASAIMLQEGVDKLLKILAGRGPTLNVNLNWADMDWHERRAQPPDLNVVDGPVKAVWQVSQDELGIQWADDKITIFSARQLRLACPCAACVDEWTGEPILDPDSVPADLRFTNVRSVGRYALNPTYTDGHRSGIFHFERLRGLAER